MPSRFQTNKPDPAIRRKAMRARANMQDTKGERAIVVAGSLAATIAAWALLSLPNASTPATVPAFDTNQASITITATDQTSASSTSSISTSTATSTPVASLASGAASQSVYSSQSTTTSQATTSSTSVQTTQAVAVTRSSR